MPLDEWAMFLAEKLHFHKSASIAFVWTNTIWAKPKPIYVNPQSSYFASGNPKQTERARVKGEKPSILALILSSVDIFTFVKYVHER